MHDLEPTPSSATYRRELRAKVRNALGVTRAEAPTARPAMRATVALSTLLEKASGGRYALRVYDHRTGDHRHPGDVLTELLTGEVAATEQATRAAGDARPDGGDAEQG